MKTRPLSLSLSSARARIFTLHRIFRVACIGSRKRTRNVSPLIFIATESRCCKEKNTAHDSFICSWQYSGIGTIPRKQHAYLIPTECSVKTDTWNWRTIAHKSRTIFCAIFRKSVIVYETTKTTMFSIMAPLFQNLATKMYMSEMHVRNIRTGYKFSELNNNYNGNCLAWKIRPPTIIYDSRARTAENAPRFFGQAAGQINNHGRVEFCRWV